MLDFIYTLLIAPLEYWMHAALVWGYSHTEAWGPAIVVMSLAVNVVISAHLHQGRKVAGGRTRAAQELLKPRRP